MTKKVEKLIALPCPFCGGDGETDTSAFDDRLYMGCKDCKCMLAGDFVTRKEAVKYWNKRVR